MHSFNYIILPYVFGHLSFFGLFVILFYVFFRDTTQLQYIEDSESVVDGPYNCEQTETN